VLSTEEWHAMCGDPREEGYGTVDVGDIDPETPQHT
jgi:hypothetical protein